jgi:hypothetical protein
MSRLKEVPTIAQKDRPENGGSADQHAADHGPLSAQDSPEKVKQAVRDRPQLSRRPR